MRDFATVKCLHCHYAHHAARPEHGNVIGRWVHELLLLMQEDEAAYAAAGAGADAGVGTAAEEEETTTAKTNTAAAADVANVATDDA
jgi:hypothetical protein